MQKAILYTEDGKSKRVYLLEPEDTDNLEKSNKKNWKEHLYAGYLIIGSIAFGLGILISLKRLNGK